MADIIDPPRSSSWTLKSDFRVTRRGKILKDVTERYLRDDLGYGHVMSPSSSVTALTKIPSSRALLSHLHPARCTSGDDVSRFLLICTPSVLLHNLDLLEHSAVSNFVVPQSALLAVRSISHSRYGRILEYLLTERVGKKSAIFFPDLHHLEIGGSCSVGEDAMEDCERLANWYGNVLRGFEEVKVVLLKVGEDMGLDKSVNDVVGANYGIRSVRSHVSELERLDPSLSLSDWVAQLSSSAMCAAGDGGGGRYGKAHVPLSEIVVGVKKGIYHQGILRVESRSTYLDCYVTIRKNDERVVVKIVGTEDVNRGVDGDVVAIGIHGVDEWEVVEPNTNLNTNTKGSEEVGIAQETLEPSIGDVENAEDTVRVDGEVGGQVGVLRRPTGGVIGIVRRNFKENYCGSIHGLDGGLGESDRDKIADKNEVDHADGSSTCVFFPVDERVPPVLIRTTQKERLLSKRILVAIDSWPLDTPYPLGHYVKTIGDAGNKDVETQVLLHEHDIPCDDFSPKVMACLPSIDYPITLQEGRKDMRHLPILSIDPPGCKDIDDALHCIVLPNGNFQIGVHIADVTHYIKPNTPIDIEAANRSTSTYLVNKRLDMLPGLLTTDLCSLKGNIDRYAFSILWEVTPQAIIVNVDFHKTIIHSIAALTYQQAQTLLDTPLPDKPNNDNDVDPILHKQIGAVKRLHQISTLLRHRRIQAGALTLASPEVKFTLDSQSLNPTDVISYNVLQTNALVEEFMLLANVTVSKKILRNYPTLSILRRHPSPNREAFSSLITKAQSRNFTIDISDSKHLADSLDAATDPKDPYINKLLRILSTRCMSPAQYFSSGEYSPSEWHHYGLAAPVYTHFTSPIRRYSDVCAHRLLAAAIGVDPLPAKLSGKVYQHDLCRNMNKRHRSAQMAGRASVKLHTLLFFEAGGREEEAYVMDVDGDKGDLQVMVPRYGIEGKVKLNIEGMDVVWEKESHMITIKGEGTNTDVTVRVFDKVKVFIFVKEVGQGKQKELVLDILEPKIHNPNHVSVEVKPVNNKRQLEESPVAVQGRKKKGSKKKKRKN